MLRPIAALPATLSGSPLLLALLLAAAVCLAPPALGATKIYRTVDEHGNVVFTDVPPKEGEQGRAVDLEAPNSFEPPPAPTGEARTDSASLESWLGEEEEPEADDPQSESAGGYQVRILSPANDESVRDNAGNIAVVASVEPDLRPNHRAQLYLDGALRATSPGTTFQLTNVDRGTHALEVRIVDGAGNTVAASQPTAFHLHRRSVLLQPPRGNAPAN